MIQQSIQALLVSGVVAVGAGVPRDMGTSESDSDVCTNRASASSDSAGVVGEVVNQTVDQVVDALRVPALREPSLQELAHLEQCAQTIRSSVSDWAADEVAGGALAGLLIPARLRLVTNIRPTACV